MSAQPWTKAQAKNNKKFQAKLDKITNYLVDGDWHGSFASITLADGDAVTNFVETKETLPFATLDFSRLQGGALKVERKFQYPDGEIVSEGFIVGIQPYEKSFYMISLEDNDIAFGNVFKQSGVVSLTFLEQSEQGDEGLLGVVQYTNLSGF
jgi:hypothetical protein